MKKWMLIVFIPLFVIVCVTIILWQFFLQNKIDISRTFDEDYIALNRVTDYLISLENISDATIKKADGTMVLEFGDEVEIENQDICEIISDLFEKGYKKIGKSQNDTIYFIRWKNTFGSFKGFAFSINGSGELTRPFLVDQIPLSRKDWYYYEDDYNEWRVSDRNPSNQQS